MKYLVLLLLVIIVKLSSAIDQGSAEESPCFNISNAIDPDADWFSSVKKWYYPLASRLDLYRCVHDLLETDYRNIPEYAVYYESCLEWTINADGFTLMGYNGRTRHLATTTIAQGTSDFKSEWSQGMIGRVYSTLTDNKTFIFSAACFADNQMTWNVFSTKKTLDNATKRLIYEHAKSLGYNTEYFTELRYDTCNSVADQAHSEIFDNNVIEITNIPPSTSPIASVAVPSLSTTPESLSTSSVKPKFDENPSYFCDACKRMCPSPLSKRLAKYKYYEKLFKYGHANPSN